MPLENLITVTGTLEELNARDGVTGIVRKPDGTAWLCTFLASETPRLRDAWLHTVQVTGTSSDHHIDVRKVAVAEDFWKTKTIDDLAREQGVEPVASLDDLPTIFDSRSEADAFLDWLLAERRTGRAIE